MRELFDKKLVQFSFTQTDSVTYMDSKTEIKVKLSPNIMKDILAFGSKEELKRLSAFITIEGNYTELISKIVFVLGIVFNNHCRYLFSDDKKKPVPINKLDDTNTQN